MNNWLENLRDVTRLANNITLNLTKLLEEVDFSDFLKVELLRLKYPAVCELLFRKQESFLDTKMDSQENKSKIILKRDDSQNTNRSGSYFEKHLYGKNLDDLSVPENEVDKIVELVKMLFQENNYLLLGSTSHLSIVHPINFENYFKFDLANGKLSEKEFKNARKSSQDYFNKKISDWVEEGKEQALKQRFTEINFFENRLDYEKVISAIFHLANQKSQVTEIYFDGKVGYDLNDLTNKLNNANNKIQKLYSNDGLSMDDFKQVVFNMLNSAKQPYLFEAALVNYLNSPYIQECPFSQRELKDFNIKYLKEYTEKAQTVNQISWQLFKYTQQGELENVGQNQYQGKYYIPDRAKKIMKDFLLNKALKDFLTSIIQPQPFSKDLYSINNIVLQVFDDWGSFKQQVENKKKDAFLKEFITFMNKFLETLEPTHFNFNNIKVKTKEEPNLIHVER